MTNPEIIPPANKPKRPAEFTGEIFDTICDRMANGEGLRKICEDPDMPSRQTFLRWIDKDSGRQGKYTTAREALMDWYAEDILEIAWDTSNDTIPATKTQPARCNTEWVQRSRLKVDTLKWVMSKLHPRRYGDKLTAEGEDTREALKISWQEPTNRIERIIISGPVTDDNGNILDEKQALEARIRELQERLAGNSPKPAPSPSNGEMLAIAYNPTLPPADLSPEAWSSIARVSGLIEQIAPSDETPEHVFGLIEGFLRSQFLGGSGGYVVTAPIGGPNRNVTP